MLYGIEGTVVAKDGMMVAINVGGLIFEVNVPLSTYSRLPGVGDRCKLYTELVVSENSIKIYGFASSKERELFNELRKIPKIGPRIALSVLSAMGVDEFYSAVERRDEELLSSVPGIGKKTALAIIVELSGKVPSPGSDVASEAVAALVSMGIKRPEASRVVSLVLKNNPEIGIEELVKESLRASFKRHGH